MEKRKITIVDSQSGSKVEIMTDATTFGELKKAVVNAGINVTNKDWLEGITKTSPRSDESVLPTNVKYVPKRGENAGKEIITNNLVYMLTNVEKKIKSGMDRKEAYAKVKELNLADSIKKEFGRNFTQVSTENLVSFVEKSQKKGNSVKANTKSKVDSLNKAMETKETMKAAIKKNAANNASDEVFASAVVTFIYNLPVGVQNSIVETLMRGANGFSIAEVDEIIDSVR